MDLSSKNLMGVDEFLLYLEVLVGGFRVIETESSSFECLREDQRLTENRGIQNIHP